MSAKSRFFDDMRPRSFPTEKKQLFQRKIPVPKPILSGGSMIVDKYQQTKGAPKNSFSKWKRQHEALFERKEFRTTNKTAAFVNKRNVIAHRSTAPATKFELDFKTVAPSQRVNIDEYQQFEDDCDNKLKNNFPPKLKRPQFQSMMTFSQLNRVARSEVTSFTVPLVGRQDSNSNEDNQQPSCGCRCVVVASSPIQNTDSEDDQDVQSNLQVVDASMEKAVELKRPFPTKVLANIVEEQIEIVEQQKQILQQQNEILNLQYQIEKFLLTNGSGLKNLPPLKQLQSIAPAPSVKPMANASEAIANCLDHSPKGRKSIGVMTSCNGYLDNVCSPVAAVENGSHKDTMLECINKIIENSPPMISYKQTNGSKNCRISPHRTDINISSQTLIYKASTRNNISINDPKVADRSYALHLLDMKYRPETPITSRPTNRLSPQHNAIQMTKRSPPKSTEHDFVPSISPDKYDYLIRHGLLKK